MSIDPNKVEKWYLSYLPYCVASRKEAGTVMPFLLHHLREYKMVARASNVPKSMSRLLHEEDD